VAQCDIDPEKYIPSQSNFLLFSRNGDNKVMMPLIIHALLLLFVMINVLRFSINLRESAQELEEWHRFPLQTSIVSYIAVC
jgi:hypothetical protein